MIEDYLAKAQRSAEEAERRLELEEAAFDAERAVLDDLARINLESPPE